MNVVSFPKTTAITGKIRRRRKILILCKFRDSSCVCVCIHACVCAFMHVCAHAPGPWHVWRSKSRRTGELVRVESLLPSCGFQGWRSACLAWKHVGISPQPHSRFELVFHMQSKHILNKLLWFVPITPAHGDHEGADRSCLRKTTNKILF